MRRSRPPVAPNKGRGKEIPLDQAGYDLSLTDAPRNRRERRALAAIRRRNRGKGC